MALGTMTWGRQNSENEAFEQMDYALAQGINFFDTAELYPVPPKPPVRRATPPPPPVAVMPPPPSKQQPSKRQPPFKQPPSPIQRQIQIDPNTASLAQIQQYNQLMKN